jgi:hypothetical protein
MEAFRCLLRAYVMSTKPSANVVVVKGLFLIDLFEQLSTSEITDDLTLLCVLRDGRAVYGSQKSSVSSTYGRPMQASPAAAAVGWREFMRRCRSLERSGSVHFSRYEDFVADPTGSVAAAFRALGLEWDPNDWVPGQLADRLPVEQRHLHTMVGGPPNPLRALAWRTELEPVEIAIFERIAGPELANWGYSVMNLEVGRAAIAVARLRYGVRRTTNAVLRILRGPVAS